MQPDQPTGSTAPDLADLARRVAALEERARPASLEDLAKSTAGTSYRSVFDYVPKSRLEAAERERDELKASLAELEVRHTQLQHRHGDKCEILGALRQEHERLRAELERVRAEKPVPPLKSIVDACVAAWHEYRNTPGAAIRTPGQDESTFQNLAAKHLSRVAPTPAPASPTFEAWLMQLRKAINDMHAVAIGATRYVRRPDLHKILDAMPPPAVTAAPAPEDPVDLRWPVPDHRCHVSVPHPDKPEVSVPCGAVSPCRDHSKTAPSGVPEPTKADSRDDVLREFLADLAQYPLPFSKLTPPLAELCRRALAAQDGGS